MTSLRHRIPRGHRRRDLTSSERPSRRRPSLVSDPCDGRRADVEARGSRNTVLGMAVEEVCMLPGSRASVTEIFAVVSQRGCCGEAAGTSRRSSSRGNTIPIHLRTEHVNDSLLFFFFPTESSIRTRPTEVPISLLIPPVPCQALPPPNYTNIPTVQMSLTCRRGDRHQQSIGHRTLL